MSKPNFWELDLSPLWESFLRRRKLGRTTERAREEFRAMLRPRIADPWQADNVAFCWECHVPTGDAYSVYGIEGVLCEEHASRYPACECCESSFTSLVSAGDDDVCAACRDNFYRFCDHCDDYYHYESNGHDHYNEDCCEAPAQQFVIRNDGQDPLANDQRVAITLPAGVISDEGLLQIVQYVRRQAVLEDPDIQPWDYRTGDPEGMGRKLFNLSHDLHELGNQWQRKEGNYTKRLSRLAYKRYKIKVSPSIISGVGNIASEHSRSVDFQIEVTRNLNLGPEDFAHEESCWWTDYSRSRCALKSNGGFGLRTFTTVNHYHGGAYDRVEGRAWVLPLKASDSLTCNPTSDTIGRVLCPTFETLEPDAFVVFNGYGDLEGYNAARMVAHMAGMTYRKLVFSCSPMYVNSESGYLIAPEEIAEPYTDGALHLSLNQHSDLFENEQIAQTETEKVLANA